MVIEKKQIRDIVHRFYTGQDTIYLSNFDRGSDLPAMTASIKGLGELSTRSLGLPAGAGLRCRSAVQVNNPENTLAISPVPSSTRPINDFASITASSASGRWIPTFRPSNASPSARHISGLMPMASYGLILGQSAVTRLPQVIINGREAMAFSSSSVIISSYSETPLW